MFRVTVTNASGVGLNPPFAPIGGMVQCSCPGCDDRRFCCFITGDCRYLQKAWSKFEIYMSCRDLISRKDSRHDR